MRVVVEGLVVGLALRHQQKTQQPQPQQLQPKQTQQTQQHQQLAKHDATTIRFQTRYTTVLLAFFCVPHWLVRHRHCHCLPP